jgi:FlaG/FlaF family flagellin (archaellin)
MVDSSHQIDGESRQEKAMELITATVVIVALVVMTC